MNTKFSGRKGENAAVNFLKKNGYKILERNYSAVGGEIDIIARDGKFIVFVEVKYRKNLLFEIPSEAVNFAKRRKIVRTAKMYLAVTKQTTNYCRFDIVEVVGEEGNFAINQIKNAFEEE